jgi:hypothetical protein
MKWCTASRYPAGFARAERIEALYFCLRPAHFETLRTGLATLALACFARAESLVALYFCLRSDIFGMRYTQK